MNRTTAIALSLGAMLAAACTGQPDSDPTLEPELSRDLALAASEAVELAPVGGGHALSEAEIAPPRAPVRRSASAKRPSPSVEPVSEPATIEPDEIVATAPEPEPEVVEESAPTPAVPDRPAPTRRPAPIPVDYPVGGTGGTDLGGGVDVGDAIGTVIGVVIRGGMVGDDDCDLHRRPGRGGIYPGSAGAPIGIARGPAIRGGVAINDRLPRTVMRFPR